MEQMLAISAKTKASSSIILIENHIKILKVLHVKKIGSFILIFEVFKIKVKHKIHYIFDNEAENKI